MNKADKNNALAVDSTENIVHYYDDTVSQYRRIWRLEESMAMHYGFWMDGVRNFGEALQKQNAVLAERANIKPSDHVLDAGCGVGGSSIFLAKNKGCTVRGITLSAKQIGLAQRNAERHGVADLVSFEVKDYTQTGYDTASYDVVWAVESVCHTSDKSDFLREAYRLLKPGGRLIISDGFAAKKTFAKPEKEVLDTWLNSWAITSLAYKNDFLKTLETLNFQSIDYQDMTPYVMRSAHMMRFWARLGLWHSNALRTLRIRRDYDTEAKRKNMIGSIYQYPAFRDGLSEHAIVYAEKSLT